MLAYFFPVLKGSLYDAFWLASEQLEYSTGFALCEPVY